MAKLKLSPAATVGNSGGRCTTDETLFKFMTAVIERLVKLRQLGTAHNYRAALRSFQRFRENTDIPLPDVTPRVMEEYQTYLKSSGVTLNSVSFYMRIMRAVYNRAVDQGLTPDTRPFRYVFTGMEKTRKRAIPLLEIKKINNLDLVDIPSLNFARDIFLFLFYCRGMSFIDAAFLKKTDIINGTLTYQRHKTGQRLYIKVIKPIRNLLDKYPAEESPFLLPIITKPGKNERRQYESALHRINRDLKTISEMAGLSTLLTTYVSRHSWATIASSKNIPINVISDALGHESIATTQIYLASVDASLIDKANEIVIGDL